MEWEFNKPAGCHRDPVAQAVSVGGTACAAATWVSDSTLACDVAPGGGAGLAVTLTLAAGAPSCALLPLLSYDAPRVTALRRCS